MSKFKSGDVVYILKTEDRLKSGKEQLLEICRVTVLGQPKDSTLDSPARYDVGEFHYFSEDGLYATYEEARFARIEFYRKLKDVARRDLENIQVQYSNLYGWFDRVVNSPREEPTVRPESTEPVSAKTSGK